MSNDFNKDPLAKFQTYQEVSGTGIIGIMQYIVKGENTLVVKVAGAGVGNLVTIFGKIESEDTFNSIGTVVVNDTVEIDISLIDYVRFVTTTYGGTPFDLMVSGFYPWIKSVADVNIVSPAPLPISGEVTIKAPTGPFLITTVLIGDTASNPLGAPLTDRVSLAIRNTDAVDSVFLGPTSAVVAALAVGTTSGWELFPNSADQNVDLDAGESLFLICAAGKSAIVQIFEIASTP